jgi:SNF2 family DNA or RNA helicase
MNVSPSQPFQIIYSLFEHEYLGYLFETFVVELDYKGQLTLKHQNISSKNAKEFSSGLDEADFGLVKWIDAMQQEVVMKKFYNKKVTIAEFFLKVYDPKKGDEALQEAIQTYIESLKAKTLNHLGDKMIFIMGTDGNPAWQRIYRVPEKANVLFHFRRNEDNTHYFPTIKCGHEKLEFQNKGAIIICNEPAWMIVGNKLYNFEKNVDGNKLKPFLNKKFILVPRSVEDTYYKKFVAPLVASFDVYAKGFEIRAESYQPAAILTFTELQPAQAPLSLFAVGAENNNLLVEEENPDSKILFDLSFQYGKYSFKPEHAAAASVTVEKTGDSYVFYKIRRMLEQEKRKIQALQKVGLDIKNGRVSLDKGAAFSWMYQYSDYLKQEGFALKQNSLDQKKYFLGESSISVAITENRDWFDIFAKIKFGEYEIPFLKLRNLILRNKYEFTLPNGEIAIIPEVWRKQYSELFAFADTSDGESALTLKKHHISLVQDLQTGNLAQVTIHNKLEKLKEFDKIEDFPMPYGFSGQLRPYQKAGYNWMNFLNKYKFGGCLADDMGLGKTVQTLALLQAQKEAGTTQASLLVMPTSLVYNWEVEARKFTPELKVFVYTGTHREKNIEQFDGYDLILTSYGIIRIDADLLKNYYFNYIILDESQAIKNPSSNIAKAVTQLNSRHRLILSGTPLENTTLDLWSQMTFINPGLLGTERFFRNEFLLPIEKKNDEQKMQRLYAIIKPFILRRHKSQVATELPEKIENIQYCTMHPAQEELYEETKSYFRNKILEQIDDKGIPKSQLILLQGLTKLRQIANHPRMVKHDYEGSSGKLEDVLYRLETAVSEKHKILVFSQFVKHLAILREQLQKLNLNYTYLDGSTRDRRSQVDLFQQEKDIQIFLISLKAGGLGLNLTAADYVFILDPWWNPAIESQAVDRAHRIGQEQTVFTYKFITKNTVEEKILALQRSKKRLADELITTEESFVKALSKDDIISLLE